MSADRLREAARVLRERAEGAAPGPWKYPHRNYPGVVMGKHGCLWVPGSKDRHDGGHLTNEADGHYIATMHPGVGLALAEWLDAAAQDWGTSLQAAHRPHAGVIADLVLGGAS